VAALKDEVAQQAIINAMMNLFRFISVFQVNVDLSTEEKMSLIDAITEFCKAVRQLRWEWFASPD
jgi:hypothetical protein